MRRGNIFWGVILIILGTLFFLQARGLIHDVIGWFWPILLILVGLWVLGGRFLPGFGFGGKGESFSLDLQGAAKMDLEFDHGAGSVSFRGGAPSGVAITGSQAAGMEVKSHLSDTGLGVEISAGPTFIPFLGPDNGEWRFQLTEEVPVSIKVEAGASSLDFDMTGMRLAYLGVEVGASSLNVKLPANAGHTLLAVESGAASIDITVPQTVAARIRVEQGASTVNIDEKRFPRSSGLAQFYQSPDYDTAPNQVEITLEGGANTVKIQ
jgi:hypothetical protein